MSDDQIDALCEQLRHPSTCDTVPYTSLGDLCQQAADRITALAEENERLIDALEWSLDKLIDARNVCYGGVEVEEIEERLAALDKARGAACPFEARGEA